MRWRRERRSSNIEDRRRMARPGGARVGGLGLVIIVLLALVFGVDPRVFLQLAVDGGTGAAQGPATSQEQQLGDFVSLVLADTEDTWSRVFGDLGRTYQEPKLVLFTGTVRSACGYAQAAVGPFYCPQDRQVYLDLSFFDDLERRFGAPGDFAEAYVVAHEIGHHVQTLLGISQQVEDARRRADAAESNALSVRLELQADCLAGVWANRAQETRLVLDQGDLEEGLNAAGAIGDDRLQMRGRGYVVPESFTHGTSAERQSWLSRGLGAGDVAACDTFSSP